MKTVFAVAFLSLVVTGSSFGIIAPEKNYAEAATVRSVSYANPSYTYTQSFTRTWRRTPSAPATTTTPTTTPAPTTPASQPASDFAAAIEVAIHEKIHIERVKNGLKALGVDSRLTTLARAHSTDMLTNNYFSHTNQSGCSSFCRYKNAGYAYRSMGENIYMMSGYTVTATQAAEQIVQGWINSSGHRANILNSSYTVEGIGVSVAGKKIYATENFALPR